MPRFIAYYLPQYHPISENDLWWGKGFTEWTNVVKAKPFFKEHYQPRYPADLGYYDLRVPEIREQQATIAGDYGLEGFIYYHYWFGNGRVLLERPFQDVLNSKKPNFPFCLCWANENWRGAWFGEFTNKLLIEQKYAGKKDYEKHFYYLLPAFLDERYIKVDGKPVFNVYMPLNLPNIKEFSDIFNELAIREGLPGMFLVGSRCSLNWNPSENNFDGVIGSEISAINFKEYNTIKKKSYSTKLFQKNVAKIFPALNEKFLKKMPVVVEYADVIDRLITDKVFDFDYYPCVVPNWDNTPRAEEKGLVFHNSSPELFYKQLKKAIDKVSYLPEKRKFIFIKSWNEWAEGNYLEPDKKFGYQYLEQILKAVNE
ncbi:MAG: glycosyltransferase WbsX family protein [Chitinophagaceae bacterium]